MTDRYANEIAFSNQNAEKRLSSLPAHLRLPGIEPFEKLCESIHYLRSVPGFFGPLAGKKILEMGCGDGWIALRFAKSGADVHACDISPKVIQLAERYAQAADLNVKFDVMKCEELEYEDNSFDFVFMHFALHHCDVRQTTHQVRRVLKQGGRAVFIEDYAYHPLLRIYRLLTPESRTKHEHPLSYEEVATVLSGFSSHSVEYSGLLNIFETSQRPLVRALRPMLSRIDEFLYRHLHFLDRYSRVVIVKVVK